MIAPLPVEVTVPPLTRMVYRALVAASGVANQVAEIR